MTVIGSILHGEPIELVLVPDSLIPVLSLYLYCVRPLITSSSYVKSIIVSSSRYGLDKYITYLFL